MAENKDRLLAYDNWLKNNEDKAGTEEYEIVKRGFEDESRKVIGQATTLGGISGAITRGGAPLAAGALGGAALGAPIAGVGAVPGAVAGAGAMALTQVLGTPIVSGINAIFGTNIKDPTEAMEELFTRAGVPEPKTKAEKMLQGIVEGAAGAGGVAAVGKQLARSAGPVASRVGQALGAEVPAQVVSGAVAPVGAELAGEAAREVGLEDPTSQSIAQVGGALLGGMAPAAARRAMMTRIRPRSATGETAEVVAAGERADIPVYTSDIAPPTTFAGKTGQFMTERIPIAGTGGMRAKQAVKRVKATEDLLKDYGAFTDAPIIDDIAKDLISKREAFKTRFIQRKKEALDTVLDVPDNVNVNKTISQIDKEVSQLRAASETGNSAAISKLEGFKQDLLKPKNIRDVDGFRKTLGEAFKEPGLAGVKSQGEAAVNRIYKPLRDDMGDFIKSHGGQKAYTKWRVATKGLKNLIDDTKKSTLKRVLNNAEATPEEARKLLFSTRPSDVKALARNLTPEGKELARGAILQEAIMKSGGIDAINPDAFVKQAKRLGGQTGIFFTGNDKARLEGFKKVIQATKRAVEAGHVTPTGQQLSLPLAGVAAYFAPAAGYVAGGVGLAGLTARLYESAPVRRMLTQLGRVKPGGAEEAALFKRIAASAQNLLKSRQPEESTFTPTEQEQSVQEIEE